MASLGVRCCCLIALFVLGTGGRLAYAEEADDAVSNTWHFVERERKLVDGWIALLDDVYMDLNDIGTALEELKANPAVVPAGSQEEEQLRLETLQEVVLEMYDHAQVATDQVYGKLRRIEQLPPEKMEEAISQQEKLLAQYQGQMAGLEKLLLGQLTAAEYEERYPPPWWERQSAGAGGGEGGGAIEASGGQMDSESEEQEEAVRKLELELKEYEGMLFMDASKRDVQRGIAGLLELAKPLEEVAPSAPKARRRLQPREGGARAGPWKVPASPRPQTPPGDDAATAPAAGSSIDSHLIEGGGYFFDDPTDGGLSVASDAMFVLAALVAGGVVPDALPRSPEWAVRRLHVAALAGSVDAHLALADRYFQGRGVPVSCQMGFSHARIAAEHFYSTAEADGRVQLPLAPVQLRERWRDASYSSPQQLENSEEQIALEEDMAMRGHVEMLNYLGYRQLVGRGLEPDPEAALRHFQAAAQRGDAYAIYNLGYMHLQGTQLEKNYTKARQMFETAAAQGLPAAYNGLGALQTHGLGVPVNHSAAVQLFRKGAAYNDPDSVFNLGTMYAAGLGVPQNDSKAVALMHTALELGHWRAPFHLALYSYEGVGMPMNCTAAQEHMWMFISERSLWSEQMDQALASLDEDNDPWAGLVQYLLLAEQGNDAALTNAAWMLERRLGFDGPQHAALAAQLYLRSAALQNHASMVDAGNLLLKAAAARGTATPQLLHAVRLHRQRRAAAAAAAMPQPASLEEAAVELFQEAMGAGSAEAAAAQGWCAQQGLGMPANASRASELYWAAVELGWNSHEALPSLLLLVQLHLHVLLGPTARQLHQLLLPVLQPLAVAARAASAAVLVSAGGAGVLPAQLLRWAVRVLRHPLLVSAQRALQQLDVEQALMAALSLGLAVVVALRHNRRRHAATPQMAADEGRAASPSTPNPARPAAAHRRSTCCCQPRLQQEAAAAAERDEGATPAGCGLPVRDEASRDVQRHSGTEPVPQHEASAGAVDALPNQQQTNGPDGLHCRRRALSCSGPAKADS